MTSSYCQSCTAAKPATRHHSTYSRLSRVPWVCEAASAETVVTQQLTVTLTCAMSCYAVLCCTATVSCLRCKQCSRTCTPQQQQSQARWHPSRYALIIMTHHDSLSDMAKLPCTTSAGTAEDIVMHSSRSEQDWSLCSAALTKSSVGHRLAGSPCCLTSQVVTAAMSMMHSRRALEVCWTAAYVS